MYRTFRKSELQARLKENLAKYPRIQRNSKRQQSSSLTSVRAAIGLIVGEDQDGVDYFLLTQRSEKLHSHQGQVALPGGVCDSNDQGDLLQTLKREVQEEVGLGFSQVSWCESPWDSVVSINIIEVHPFLGIMEGALDLKSAIKIDPMEVQNAEWLPLSQLFDEKMWEWRTYERSADDLKLQMPVWKGWSPETWGLTAIVLSIFVRRISGASPY